MGRMSELAAERESEPGPDGHFAGQKIVTSYYSPEGIWHAWYDGDGDLDGMELGDGGTEQSAIDELVAVHPRIGAQCPDCFFMTPIGVSRCASCDGTGAQLPTA